MQNKALSSLNHNSWHIVFSFFLRWLKILLFLHRITEAAESWHLNISSQVKSQLVSKDLWVKKASDLVRFHSRGLATLEPTNTLSLTNVVVQTYFLQLHFLKKERNWTLFKSCLCVEEIIKLSPNLLKFSSLLYSRYFVFHKTLI